MRKAIDCEKEISFMLRDTNRLDRWVVPGVAALLAVVVAGGMLVSTLRGQSSTPAANPAAGLRTPSAGAPTRSLPSRFPRRASVFYGAVWGVDSLTVKSVESGELVRFSYHVLDANKAKTLNDKKLDAFLIAPDARIRLSIPSLENVGQLRQSSTPEADKVYWMAFSNPGRRVRRGDRVDVVIGQFHAQGLVVE